MPVKIPVFVVSSTGKPLMPSCRYAHIRLLLKQGKAKVVTKKPFTIRLCYESTEYTQSLYGGTDPGRTNIGEAVLDEQGVVQYAAHVETSLKDFIESVPAESRQRVLSEIQVIPSKRHYNDLKRRLPGAIFYFQGHRYVQSGQSSGGTLLRAVGMGAKNFPAKQCTTIPSGGLVYL